MTPSNGHSGIPLSPLDTGEEGVDESRDNHYKRLAFHDDTDSDIDEFEQPFEKKALIKPGSNA